ncbi:MAG: hydrogen gas-evolving membrane-bound hydrogenase subunit E [Clostridia bacterium]
MSKNKIVLLSFVILILALFALRLNVSDFTYYGNHNNTSLHYISEGVNDTGAVNIVSAILFDYRGFDTLGEAIVLFCVASAISMLFTSRVAPKKSAQLSVLARAASLLYSPCIVIFGVYIIIHGHLSPGGGFQGGVILASIVLLHLVVFGESTVLKYISYKKLAIIESLSLLLFIGIGLLPMIVGSPFLTNLTSIFPKGTPGELLSGGNIGLLNIATGSKVAASVAVILLNMIKRTEEDQA